MKLKITFYSDKVENHTLKYPPGILANFLHIAEMIEELGPNLGKPYVGTLGSGLYEIRAKSKEGIGRSIVLCSKGKRSRNITFNYQKDAKDSKKGIGYC